MKMMALVALMVVFAGVPFRVESHELKIGDMVVSDVWARATISGAKAGGAFMMIKNKGAVADKLISVKTDISKKASVHQTKIVNGVMHMNPVNGLVIDPGASVMLKPGSYHVMFMGLKKGLKQGDAFPMTLVFEKAGSLDVMVQVQKPGARKMNHNVNN